MNLVQINPKDIRVDDSPFVYSYGSPLRELEESISRLGVLNPPRVWQDTDGNLWCVTGSRRIFACFRLGVSSVPVLVHPPDTSPALLFKIAIDDNRLHRPLNLVECGRIIAGLERATDLTRASIISVFFPRLGLSPRPEEWAILSALAEAPEPVPGLVARDGISFKNLCLLLQFNRDEQALLATVISDFHLGTNRQQQLLNMVADGTRRFHLTALRLLTECGAWPPPEPGDQNLPQRTVEFMDHLHRRLWPTLSRREKQFGKIKGYFAGLGPPARLDHYPYFEKREFRLEITFRSPEELRRLAHALDRDETETALRPLFKSLPEDED